MIIINLDTTVYHDTGILLQPNMPPMALVWVQRNLPESKFSGNSSGGLPRRLPTSSPWKLNPAKSVCLEYVVFSYLWFSAQHSSEAGGHFGSWPEQRSTL